MSPIPRTDTLDVSAGADLPLHIAYLFVLTSFHSTKTFSVLQDIMLDVGIRSVKDSDEATLDAIYQACIEKRPDIKGIYTSGVLDLTVPEYQRRWKAEGFPVLVATLGESPVGIGWLIPDEECSASPL